jgi:hypothetical protein
MGRGTANEETGETAPRVSLKPGAELVWYLDFEIDDEARPIDDEGGRDGQIAAAIGDLADWAHGLHDGMLELQAEALSCDAAPYADLYGKVAALLIAATSYSKRLRLECESRAICGARSQDQAVDTANPTPEPSDTIEPPDSADSRPLRDLDIRHALRAHFADVHAGDTHTRVFEEMELGVNAARVDLAVVNGRLEGFEIKSDHDRLDRLPRQAEVYNRVFDCVTVVTGRRYIDAVVEAIPTWWGVTAAEASREGVRLRVVRPTQANPAPDTYSVAQLLRRAEALAILEEVGAADGVRSKPLPHVWQRLADALPADELGRRVRDALVIREDWRESRRSSAGGDRSRPRARSSGSRSVLPPHKRR